MSLPSQPDAIAQARALAQNGPSVLHLMVLLAGYLIAFAQRQLPLAMAQPMARDLGLDDAALGALHGTSFGLVYGLLAIPCGFMADRLPQYRLVTISLATSGIATVLAAHAHSIEILWGLRMLTAAAQALLLPATFSILGSVHPRFLGLAVACISTGPFVGTALVYGAGAASMGLAWRDPYVWVGTTAIMLSAVLAWQRTAAPSASGVDVDSSGDRAVKLNAKAIIFVILAMILIASGGHAMLGWTNIWLVRAQGIDMASSAAVFASALLLAGTAGALSGGWISDLLSARRCPRALVLASFAIMTAGASLGFYSSAVPVGAIIWLAPFVFLFAATHGLGQITLQSLAPQHLRGRLHGIAICLINLIAFAAAPVSVGLLSDASGSPQGLGMVLAVWVPITLVGAALSGAACWRVAAAAKVSRPARA